MLFKMFAILRVGSHKTTTPVAIVAVEIELCRLSQTFPKVAHYCPLLRFLHLSLLSRYSNSFRSFISIVFAVAWVAENEQLYTSKPYPLLTPTPMSTSWPALSQISDNPSVGMNPADRLANLEAVPLTGKNGWLRELLVPEGKRDYIQDDLARATCNVPR